MYDPETSCYFCDKPLGDLDDDLIGFDYLHKEITGEKLYGFGDTVVHRSCMSNWDKVDLFIEMWNKALSEYFLNKQLIKNKNGMIDYNQSEYWAINWSEKVQDINNRARIKREEVKNQKQEILELKIKEAINRAISLNLANSQNVMSVLYNMDVNTYKQKFGDLNISRIHFK